MTTQKQAALSSETFAFLDIETTGGNPQHDRITEIGIRFWRAASAVAMVPVKALKTPPALTCASLNCRP